MSTLVSVAERCFYVFFDFVHVIQTIKKPPVDKSQTSRAYFTSDYFIAIPVELNRSVCKRCQFVLVPPLVFQYFEQILHKVHHSTLCKK